MTTFVKPIAVAHVRTLCKNNETRFTSTAFFPSTIVWLARNTAPIVALPAPVVLAGTFH
jgi:hypothetical protein